MRYYIVRVILLCGMIQGVIAQNIEISGFAKDDMNKRTIEFANVVLQTKDSSSFVAGTTTDSTGYFSLGAIAKGSYLLTISNIGYKSEQLFLEEVTASSFLGDIYMEPDEVALGEVVVNGSAQTTHANKKVLFPSKRQLKASGNGMELLQQLMLPRVYVDVFNNQIKSVGNGVVQLRVNGVKVNPDEIKAIDPSEVIRVEYHDNPGLRYGDADIVLNYIVRRRKAGGSFGLDMQQGVNAMWGEHNLRGKVNHGNSEWAASYRFGPRDFYGMSRDNEEEFRLPDGKVLKREEIGEPSRANIYMHNLNLNYSYQKAESSMFNFTFRYQLLDKPHADYKGVLMNMFNVDDRVEMIDLTSSKYRTPALDIYYQHELGKDQTLLLNLVGTYNQARSIRTYQERRHGNVMTDINNRVEGDKYSIIGEAIYEKRFGDINRLGVGMRHNHSLSDNNYVNGKSYKTHMEQMNSSFYAEFKGRLKSLDYSLGVTINRSSYSQRGAKNGYEKYSVSPRLTLFFPLPGESSLRLKTTVVNVAPSLAELSAIDQSIDSLQIQRGNPSLKSHMSYYAELNYELRKGLFYMNATGACEYQPDAIMDEKYIDGDRIIQSWDNQKNWQRFVGTANLRFGPIRDILQFSFNGGVNRYISNGNRYAHRYTNWWCNANISLTWRSWSLMYMLMTNWNWFKGETMTGGENVHGINLGYRHKELKVGLQVLNPFVDNYKQESENWNQYAPYRRSNYIKESSRLFALTLTYSFSFGRKFNVLDKRVNNSDNDSGVMSSGK